MRAFHTRRPATPGATVDKQPSPAFGDVEVVVLRLSRLAPFKR